MTPVESLKALTRVRHVIAARLEILESFIASNAEEPEDFARIEEHRAQLQALDWSQRVVRAALVILEERTPDGVSDTVLDELQKAAG